MKLNSVSLLLLTSLGCSAPAELAGGPGIATIGPAGGTVTLGTVQLTIPPGALADDTDISITSTHDATPLPPAAVQVGPQYAIEPAGLALATPATLTVPTDPDAVARFGQSPSDCMVWGRDAGSSWTLDPAIATGSAKVQVELAELTTVAAGIRVHVGPVCNGLPCLPCSTTSSGHCVSPLPAGGPPLSGYDFAMSGSTFDYVTEGSAPGDESISAVRVNLITGQVTTSQPLVYEGGFLTTTPPTVDVDGSLWVGIYGVGNGQLAFTGASQLFDIMGSEPSAPEPLGAALMPTGLLARMTTAAHVDRAGTLYSRPEPWTSDGKTFAVLTAAADNGSGDPSAWVFDFAPHFVSWDFVTAAPTVTPSTYYPAPSRVAVAHDGAPGRPSTVAATNLAPNPADGQVEPVTSFTILPSGGTPTVVNLQFFAGQMAFDDNDKLWIADADAPEIATYDPVSGGLSMTLLTSAAFGTAAYANAIPMSVHATSGGIVVLTIGHQLLLVR